MSKGAPMSMKACMVRGPIFEDRNVVHGCGVAILTRLEFDGALAGHPHEAIPVIRCYQESEC